ncbi:hypothetical protein PN466_19260 [Roseofilum reptotaenium CS-1145]|uniref:Sporulation/spore germination protein n=1 Tax=Roseofilum reptotaenium AO1-A TaxID=1925591 RepID=A0A1L9QT53_9CYAN|nr:MULTISPECIES: hypothetical protein [Roseofilum]MBP0028226.1 hypothetical protein [Roseofilum sp. Guam]MDB9519087.1 hypothetical protein [Roseofilum reptotaenium CS-1145]OJJ25843.1 hypothetical protein BI308_08880 [Roseofilum reptotaenium AO1-A]
MLLLLNRQGSIAPLSLAIALIVTGCTSSHSTELTPTPAPVPKIAQRLEPTPAVEMIEMTVYQLDPFCESFVEKSIQVPEQNALQATIHNAIEEGTTADFTIAGYRLQPNPTDNSLTIDFRLSPQSGRLFVSLSTCERMALLGSLKETLTQSSRWNIEEVKFTDRGVPIGF